MKSPLSPRIELEFFRQLWQKSDDPFWLCACAGEDFVLMAVNPGFGGQSFINGTLKKLREVRRMIDDSGYPIRLEVDGGVKIDNIRTIAEAGADTFVAGSAIFNTPDYRATIAAMRAELAKVDYRHHV